MKGICGEKNDIRVFVLPVTAILVEFLTANDSSNTSSDDERALTRPKSIWDFASIINVYSMWMLSEVFPNTIPLAQIFRIDSPHLQAIVSFTIPSYRTTRCLTQGEAQKAMLQRPPSHRNGFHSCEGIGFGSFHPFRCIMNVLPKYSAARRIISVLIQRGWYRPVRYCSSRGA